MAETPADSSWQRRLEKKIVDKELQEALTIGWRKPSVHYISSPTGPQISENCQKTPLLVNSFKTLEGNPLLAALQESFYNF